MLHEDDPARRVVVAVDVPSARPAGTEDPTVVEVDDVVPFRLVGAVLADAADAEDRRRRGPGRPGRRRTRTPTGSPSAAWTTSSGWWAAQEIGDLLAGTGLT